MIKDLPDEERPRERLIKYGKENVSNEDLISIILKTGTKDKSVKDLSNQVLSMFKSVNELKNININTLTKIKGIGYTKSIELIASLELGRRVYYMESISNKISIKNGKDIFDYFKYIFSYSDQEKFYTVYLDIKHHIIDIKLLFIGTVNYSVIHPREIFKHAYLLSASFIICVHNHPSGDVKPSDEDIRLTNELFKIGEMQKIPLLDHIIIGSNSFYSFYEKNKIKSL